MGLDLIEVEGVFERLIASALGSGRVKEVAWITAFHSAVERDLETELLATPSRTGSVRVKSALVHGTTFTVDVPPSGKSGTEIGDLLLVGESFKGTEVVEREALLLQMKVGLGRPSGSSSANQLALYGNWTTVSWRKPGMRADLPPTHPRKLNPGDRTVARFGLLPTSGSSPSTALCREVEPSADLSLYAMPLAAAMALPVCLTVGVDATPGPSDGWPRVVEDMLWIARERHFMSEPRLHQVELRYESRSEHRDRLLVIVVQVDSQDID